MNTRRKFLTMLGLGAIAGPTIATAVQGAAEASEVSEPIDMRAMIEAQRQINLRRSACLEILNRRNNVRIIA